MATVRWSALSRLCFAIVKAIRRFSVRTVLPEPISALGELASNLHWCWHPGTRDLFERIDPQRWARVGKDPVALLSALSADELTRLASDEAFVATVNAAAQDLATYLSKPRWYQNWAAEVEGGAPASIAYFSPEFGITEVLPQYSGAWASWLGTISSLPPTWGCPSSASGCSTRPATSSSR
jgi:starch phosphorylase